MMTFFLSVALCASGRDYVSIHIGNDANIRDVASVRVDDTGFVWASTRLGVVRLASGSSKSYLLPADNSSIRTVKLEYAGGKLYAYLDTGKVFIYDVASDKFVTYADIGGLVPSANLHINQILCDIDGNLWVASSAGVFKYCPDGTASPVVFSDYVGYAQSMCPDGDDTLFLSSVRGIVRINRLTDSFSAILGPDSRLKATSSMYDRSAGRLWIGTRSEGLFYLDDGSDVLHQVEGLPSNIPVMVINKYGDGLIFVGTDGAGLFSIDAASARVVAVDRHDVNVYESIGSNSIFDICPLGNKVLVATGRAGLNYFNEADSPITLASHRTNDTNSLSNNHVNGVYVSTAGEMYIATDAGVDTYNPINRRWSHFCDDVICNSVFVDSCNRLWVGTYGNGFHIFNASSMTEKSHFLESPSGSGRTCPVVRCFFEDNDGDTWILGYNTVILYDSGTGLYRDYASLAARSGCVAPDGRICLACNQGLLLLDKDSGESEVICEGMMMDVCSDENGVWAASSGLGLIHYELNSGTLSRITKENGLNTNFVNSVNCGEGLIWAGTETGLNSYNTKTGEIDAYQDIPLLSKSNFNAAAAFIQSDGTHLYGTGEGMVEFHPDRLDRCQARAAMYIEDIRFSGISVRDMNSFPAGKAVNEINEYKVRYQHNNFAIDLTAVGDLESDFYFTWTLDEMDGNWSPPRKTNLCRYTNLKVGKNHFHLRLVDGLGKTVYDSRDLLIVVLPPFWKTWWFILMSAVLLLYLVCSVWMYHSAKLKSRVVPIINISRFAERRQKKNDTPEAYEDPFVRKAIEVVTANLQNQDFDKDAFAKEMGVSASSLYKKLKLLSDQSPTDFIKTIKMTNALNLLQSHKYSVTEVSEMCGYSSPSYFSTAFKNFYGKSPVEI